MAQLKDFNGPVVQTMQPLVQLLPNLSLILKKWKISATKGQQVNPWSTCTIMKLEGKLFYPTWELNVSSFNPLKFELSMNMTDDCWSGKCHGVSGSCEFKTCWRGTPSFKEIGHVLKSKFETATEVKVLPETKSLIPTSLLSSSPQTSKRSSLSKVRLSTLFYWLTFILYCS